MVHGSKDDSGREEIGKSGGIAYSRLAKQLTLFTLVVMLNVTVGFSREKD